VIEPSVRLDLGEGDCPLRRQSELTGAVGRSPNQSYYWPRAASDAVVCAHHERRGLAAFGGHTRARQGVSGAAPRLRRSGSRACKGGRDYNEAPIESTRARAVPRLLPPSLQPGVGHSRVNGGRTDHTKPGCAPRMVPLVHELTRGPRGSRVGLANHSGRMCTPRPTALPPVRIRMGLRRPSDASSLCGGVRAPRRDDRGEQ
jgi:hypothetical protein